MRFGKTLDIGISRETGVIHTTWNTQEIQRIFWNSNMRDINGDIIVIVEREGNGYKFWLNGGLQAKVYRWVGFNTSIQHGVFIGNRKEVHERVGRVGFDLDGAHVETFFRSVKSTC